jgi:4-amino-4-deoxy-L-arabinose transferase-like glycosyltransferase
MSSLTYSAAVLQPSWKKALAPHLALLLILVVALTLRFLWMIFLTGTIDAEGAEYARIAENLLSGGGYVGIATPGTELMFPPLFPFLIAGAALLIGDAELAGRLLSVTMGTLFILPIYSITMHLYGRSAAYIGATLVALHPLLVGFSATVYCETMYMTLVLSGIACSLHARDSFKAPAFIFAGVFFGLAYLVRPEAILYPIVALALLLFYTVRTTQQLSWPVAVRGILLVTVFVLIAAPYLAWLFAETGEVRIEGKGAIVHAIAKQIVAGTDPNEAQYGIGPALNEEGVWMRSNISIIETTDTDIFDLITVVQAHAKHNIPVLVRDVSAGLYMGSPVLFAVFVLGLYCTRWTMASVTDHLIVFLVPGVAALALCFHFNVDHRYMLLFVPTMIVLAAKGMLEASAIAAFKLVQWNATWPTRRLQIGAQVVLASMVVGLASLGTAQVTNLIAFDFRSRYVRDAGEWLRAFEPGPKTLMDTSTIVSYHANASYIPFPYSDGETALRYIDKKGIDFLVLREAWGRPYLADWIENGVPDERARLIYSARRGTLDSFQRVMARWGLGSSYVAELGSRLVARFFPPRPLLIYSWTSDNKPSERGSAAASELLPAARETGALRQPARGPLVVDADNPRYFADGFGRPVYLTGSHTWSTLQDAAPLGSPDPFEYEKYLDFLEQHNHNFFRLWVWEQADWAPWRPYHYRIGPTPYARPGPGKALDGKPQFDLTKFEASYFARLRTRVIQAQMRGIYVSVMLFNGFSVERKGLPWENPWRGHPFHRENNINGIDGDPENVGDGRTFHSLQSPRILRLQEDYVETVIDSVGDLDNVLFEICNECGKDSTEWQYHMVRFIRKYEAMRAKQHPIGMTVMLPGGNNQELFDSPADWISTNGADGYDSDPPAADGRKVILIDSDHIWGMGGGRQWIWKSFLKGLNPIFMDPYDNKWFYPPTVRADDGRWQSMRWNMGYTLAYANRVNLSAMEPRGDLASTGFCLANIAGIRPAFLVYAPTGGAMSVDLSGVSGEMAVEWFDPGAGVRSSGGKVLGGARRWFTAPFDGDAVLYIFSTR